MNGVFYLRYWQKHSVKFQVHGWWYQEFYLDLNTLIIPLDDRMDAALHFTSSTALCPTTLLLPNIKGGTPDAPRRGK
ncbi:hypothetical protein FHS27_004174 [Rhodopirellula rubra]|uniref:Uncharacterized protein n=1 Tax=Aporhodopirellula rubra TaxID=980271 RepID=A0A7W5E1A8_9BACT|nr:hypothetical protein [Aporhodopirellula rubra]